MSLTQRKKTLLGPRSGRRCGPAVVGLTAAAVLTSLIQTAPPATAAVSPPKPTFAASAPAAPSARVDKPGKRLGPGWKTSKDRAITSAADSHGLDILVADSATAYTWKTVTSLAEPAMSADTWIGNQCALDADHIAAVYAPRTFTNKPDLMQGGAFAAIVNIASGKVVKLPFTVSLAYFDPSCNTSTHTAAFTAFRDMNDPAKTKTRVVTVNTTGRITGAVVTAGEVTSAVPARDGVIGALGRNLIRLDEAGKATTLATADSPPFDIRVTAQGHPAFLDRHGSSAAHAKLWQGHGEPVVIAFGELGAVDLRQGAAGRVFLTGKPSDVHPKNTGVTVLNAPANTDISTLGRLAVNPVLTPGVRHGLSQIKNAGKGFKNSSTEPQLRPVGAPDTVKASESTTVTSTSITTGEKITQSLQEHPAGNGGAPSPALTGTASPAPRTVAADSRAHDPVDTDRWCSVPRNDVASQALQPTPNQVEWAVDMAVRGELHAKWLTQGGWRDQTGLGTIDPQGLFPLPKLTGGGRIPANILLGVMAQESNLWQAEPGAIPGQMSSPLASYAGFYGHKGDNPTDYWKINWANSDCGYGVGQVTDGMRLAGHEKSGETALAPAVQRGVALDYTVNVAASLYILADKWNEIHESDQTITINDDDASRPENWFAALWNYNLGFNSRSDATKNGNWGLGWYNNPANPAFKQDRLPFMDMTADPTNWPWDAAHPEYWPYEEKVEGWAAWSIDTGFSYATSGRQDWPGESGYATAGFRPAWWSTDADRRAIKPPLDMFCNTHNNCELSNLPHCPDAACYTKYWWHEPNVTWKKDCVSCGHENIKYQTLVAEPGRGYRLQHGTPTCSTDNQGLPSGALIVNSVPDNTTTYSSCGTTGTDNGSFEFTFNSDGLSGPGLGQYEAKGDLYQIGGGYDGHFWYAHTRDSAHLGGDQGAMTVKGTWTLGQNLDGWARVFVQLPDTGAQTQQAHYVIRGVAGGDRDRYLNTHYSKNTWAELGVYHFTSTPKVELTNTADDGTADDDVAFTSIAFQKLPGKPKHLIVAMGDSYSSGEGAGDYSPESDTSHGTNRWNACRRSVNSWGRKVILPDQSSTIGSLADGHSSSVDFQNVTCSGAKTWQLTGGDPSSWGLMGNYHEKTQIDSGVLSSDTTLVMLTIGGNDGDNFTNAVKNCYVIGVCDRKDYTGKADQAVTDTGDLINQIQAQAPYAQIVLMGYPRIVSDQPCVTADFDTLNYLADYVHDKQKAKVEELQRSGTKVAFADPIPTFKSHGICDDDEWINRTVAGPNGDGDFHAGDPANQLPCIPAPGNNICLSLESFHPKNAGTTGYAQVMDQALADIGYKGN
ncbi:MULTISPECIES: SGNH/GDSL hydrolase family protein [unclassified Streptomyces]|uniref:SGNH/GDSL hydrolase family protein n=1 Tax=unclassified Streptomyces TaxID=2593676 RepID=UPI001F4F686D|nr:MULTISPECIES: SGNH/GDSL hydrolase family protein [unclassified Streptomyces]